MSATLCVDAGTTMIKSVIFDSDGTAVATASRGTAIRSPRPGHMEQSMAEVLDAVIATITEAVSRSPLPVSTIVLTAQGDGFWPVGAARQPAGPAILWNDARSADIIARWSVDGTLEDAFRINGSLSNLGLPNAILRTLLVEDVDRVSGYDAVLTCGSWVFLGLTGVTGLHESDASAPWMRASSGEIDDELIDMYGLSAQRHLIPPILRGAELVHPLLPKIAALIGVPAGTPVVLAPYDVVATGTGSGAVEDGDAFCILGTTLCTGVLHGSADTSGTPSGLTLATGPGAPWTRAYPTLAGTGVLDWTATLLGLPGAAALGDVAAESPAGARGMTVWPYLSPAGERAPFLDSSARGVIGNVRLDHQRSDLARAVFEGLAHVILDCVLESGANVRELTLSGGGAASALWCQTIADVTGLATRTVTDEQVGAKGAMIFAAVATGTHPNIATATAHLVRRGTLFEPDASTHAMFESRHQDFIDSRGTFAERWAAWAGRTDG